MSLTLIYGDAYDCRNFIEPFSNKVWYFGEEQREGKDKKGNTYTIDPAEYSEAIGHAVTFTLFSKDTVIYKSCLVPINQDLFRDEYQHDFIIWLDCDKSKDITKFAKRFENSHYFEPLHAYNKPPREAFIRQLRPELEGGRDQDIIKYLLDALIFLPKEGIASALQVFAEEPRLHLDLVQKLLPTPAKADNVAQHFLCNEYDKLRPELDKLLAINHPDKTCSSIFFAVRKMAVGGILRDLPYAEIASRMDDPPSQSQIDNYYSWRLKHVSNETLARKLNQAWQAWHYKNPDIYFLH